MAYKNVYLNPWTRKMVGHNLVAFFSYGCSSVFRRWDGFGYIFEYVHFDGKNSVAFTQRAGCSDLEKAKGIINQFWNNNFLPLTREAQFQFSPL
jgi:hypothetical protein